MKVLHDHHKYELASFEGGEPQVIQFIEKEKVGDTFETINDGTTNEEILEMLIDRMKGLLAKLPSYETQHALFHVESALLWLEKRTNDRRKRGVEGTPKA